MTRMPQERELVGRKIVGFKANPFADGRGGLAHDPALVLDDGSILRFVVEETDVHEYGVFVRRILPRK